MKSAEETLKDNLNESLWTFISTYPVAYKSDVMLKDWILEATEEYAEEYYKEKTRQINSDGYFDIALTRGRDKRGKRVKSKPFLSY